MASLASLHPLFHRTLLENMKQITGLPKPLQRLPIARRAPLSLLPALPSCLTTAPGASVSTSASSLLLQGLEHRLPEWPDVHTPAWPAPPSPESPSKCHLSRDTFLQSGTRTACPSTITALFHMLRLFSPSFYLPQEHTTSWWQRLSPFMLRPHHLGT